LIDTSIAAFICILDGIVRVLMLFGLLQLVGTRRWKVGRDAEPIT